MLPGGAHLPGQQLQQQLLHDSANGKIYVVGLNLSNVNIYYKVILTMRGC